MLDRLPLPTKTSSMSPEIPDFGGTPCRDLTVCAHIEDIEDVDVATRRRLQRYEDGELVVHIKQKHCFAVVDTGGRTDNHFHVDLYAEPAFDDAPKPTGSVRDFGGRFKIIEGHQIRVDSDATFVVTVDRLPPIVLKTMVSTQAGDVEIKVTGGRLSVTGAHVSRITWWLHSNESEAAVRIHTQSNVFPICELRRSAACHTVSGATGTRIAVRQFRTPRLPRPASLGSRRTPSGEFSHDPHPLSGQENVQTHFRSRRPVRVAQGRRTGLCSLCRVAGWQVGRVGRTMGASGRARGRGSSACDAARVVATERGRHCRHARQAPPWPAQNRQFAVRQAIRGIACFCSSGQVRPPWACAHG